MRDEGRNAPESGTSPPTGEIGRLRGLAGRITEAMPVAEVARALISQGVEALSASAGAVALIDPEIPELEVIEAIGWSPAQVEAHRRIPLDAQLPLAQAARVGEPLWRQDEAELSASVPLSVDGRVIGAFSLGFPTRRTFGGEERGFVLALANAMAQALGRAQLHEAEKRGRVEAEAARRRLAILADASAALGGIQERDETLVRVAGIAATLADACAIDLVDGAQVRRVAVAAGLHDAGAPIASALRVTAPDPQDPDDVVMRVIRGGEAESATLGEGASASETALVAAGARFQTVVPVWARGRSLGAMTLMWSKTLRSTAPSEAALARELGLRIGLWVENALLFEQAERMRRDVERAAARTARLQAITAALGRAVTPLEVAEVVIAEGVAALGASGGALGLVEDDGAHVRIVRAVGMADSTSTEHRRVPLDASHPIGEALLRAEALFYEAEGGCAGAALPLVVEERRLGGIVLTFEDRRAVAAEDRTFAAALARQCAQAIDRALLFDAQRVARAAAERARERVSFLAEASATFAVTLDWETTLEHVVRLAVPRLADWCVIDLREGATGPAGVAVAHVDPQKEQVLREIRRRAPQFPAPSEDAEVARMLREIGFEASLVVPLAANGQTLGMLSLGATGAERAFGPDDVAIAEELAHRAAFAVANARLYADAQEAVRSRDEFLSVASHELRTPLTALQLQLQAVQRRLGAVADGRSETNDLGDKLEGSMRQVRRLAGLVDALLDISRITAGRLDLQRDDVDVVVTVREVIDRYQDVLVRTGGRIDVEAPASLIGRWDPMRIDQVVTNLVSNAIKYGEGRPVAVRVEGDGVRAVLAVIDNGIGIPRDKQARIFDRFERAVSVRHYGGLGLGLWIVRQIVEAHGGAITVESREGSGSTFRIELPLEPPPPARESKPPPV